MVERVFLQQVEKVDGYLLPVSQNKSASGK